MRALSYPAKDEIRLGDLPEPSPGPGEALVAVRASGICGTDIEVLHGHYGTGAFPLVPGHEFAGEVVALGPDVAGLRLGDRVVVDPNLPCGACDPCLRGLTNLCERLGAYGVTVNGGFAEYCAVRADKLHGIGELDYPTAALAEPVACVLNGIRAVGGASARHALIFGAGPIGLLMALTLRAKGVGEVALADIAPDRRARAEGFGFAGLAPGDLEDRVQAVDLVVDCTGVPAVAAGLTRYAINGGRVLYFGVCPPAARIEIAPFEIFRRQLTLAGSHSLNQNIPEALEVLAAHGPEMARVISDRVPLGEIAPFLEGGGGPHLKVQAVAP